MLGKRFTFCTLYLLLCVIVTMTSSAARSQRHQRHHLREGGGGGGGRTRGGGRHHRGNNNNDNNNDNKRQRGFGRYGGDHNESFPFLAGEEGGQDERQGRGFFRPEERTVDGISVPALHSMQTYGLTSFPPSVDRGKDRRPIRGSRKAVVVTKKTYLKKEKCKTQPLEQVVRKRGCLRTKILNNFCYGQCNSFFIPKKARRDKKAEAFLSCGFCRPRRFRWILVNLRCPGKHGMRYKRMRVQFIKSCRCMAQEVSMPSYS